MLFASIINSSQNCTLIYAAKVKANDRFRTKNYWRERLNQLYFYMYSKTYVRPPLSKRPQIGFQDQLSLNAGQKYCKMLQRENSAILLTFIKLPFVLKIFVLAFFEWPFYTSFIELSSQCLHW